MIERLRAPRDIAAIVVFRIAFGAMVAISAVRFLAYGWIELFFDRPAFHFTYWGLSWVRPLPTPGMHGVFALLAVLGVMVAAGLFYRVAIVAIFVLFTYVQAVDVTTYLNHYYLVSLLAGLLCFIPAHRAASLDVLRHPELRADTLPAWCTHLLRFQVAIVYVNAGLAKLGADWLLHAQPLGIWLTARTGLPFVGAWLDQPWAAYVAAWSGFLFDSSIVLFLLWRRTRPFAYVAVLGFHAATAVLFPIGMFPVIMTCAACIFFAPDWPRRFFTSRALPVAAPPRAAHRLAGAGFALAAVFALVQLVLPFRTHLYGGNVLWHEQGMRFSWRVMAREKNGSVTFHVKDRETGRRFEVPPSRYLTRIQEREMSVQPDLILQLAHHIAADVSQKSGHTVEVRADAIASLNGRPAHPLVDPTIDLAAEEDGLGPKRWILPAPSETPPHLGTPAAHATRWAAAR